MALFDFINTAAGALPAGATLTRPAGIWGHTSSTGLVEFASTADAPRYEYDALTLKRTGLLIEPAAANLTPYSQDATSWQLGSITASANTTTAPDGTATADTLTASGSGATLRYVRPNGPYTGASLYAAFFMKAGTQRYAQITFGGNAGAVQYANYDLQTGSVTSSAIVIATITPAANGWYRCTYLLTMPVNGGFDGPYLIFVDSGNAGRAANSAAAGTYLYVWQVDAVESYRVGSPIPTTSNSASRSAEVLTLNWGSKGVTDGTYNVVYTFDDGSMQAVSTAVAGGKAVVPTNLARSVIRYAGILTTPTSRTVVLADTGSRSLTL